MAASQPSGLSNLQRDHLIPLSEAVRMTAQFRAKNPEGVRAWLFDRRAIDALLAQKGCAGIRVYRGVGTDGSDHVLLVGTDESGTDLGAAKIDGGGLVAEIGWPCPPICGGSSVMEG